MPAIFTTLDRRDLIDVDDTPPAQGGNNYSDGPKVEAGEIDDARAMADAFAGQSIDDIEAVLSGGDWPANADLMAEGWQAGRLTAMAEEIIT